MEVKYRKTKPTRYDIVTADYKYPGRKIMNLIQDQGDQWTIGIKQKVQK